MANIAVLDTETNWLDRVMSLGVVVADGDILEPQAAKYYIFTPEYLIGGMYTAALWPNERIKPRIVSREEGMEDLKRWLVSKGVEELYAYNAGFDMTHLPELSDFRWYDIMRVAAYRQFNPKIPSWAECYKTGRMKRNYGVEPMLRLLAGEPGYHEIHNALYDARDELRIMKYLGVPLSKYIEL